jgi:hypothetical protein
MALQQNKHNIKKIIHKSFENVAMFKILERKYQIRIALTKKLRGYKKWGRLAALYFNIFYICLLSKQREMAIQTYKCVQCFVGVWNSVSYNEERTQTACST